MTIIKSQPLAVKSEWAARCIRQYNNHVINHGDIKIIGIERNLADIFTGLGWTHRSRYRKMAGRWSYVSGIRLPPAIIGLLPL